MPSAFFLFFSFFFLPTPATTTDQDQDSLTFSYQAADIIGMNYNAQIFLR
jgi:hypothetical protein